MLIIQLHLGGGLLGETLTCGGMGGGLAGAWPEFSQELSLVAWESLTHHFLKDKQTNLSPGKARWDPGPKAFPGVCVLQSLGKSPAR